MSGRSERYKRKRRGDSWFEVFKEGEEKRLGTGAGVTLGRNRDTSFSQAREKKIRTVMLSIKGGGLMASLPLSFSVDWRGVLLRVKGHVWVWKVWVWELL